MNKTVSIFLIMASCFALTIFSCKKSDTGGGGSTTCTGVNIVVDKTVTDVLPCGSPSNNGAITVNASGSTGFTYSLNGGAYQSGATFSSLGAGPYTISVKDLNGCTGAVSATIATQSKGPLFTQVRSLISSRCSGSSCHLSGGAGGGYNFDSDCNIINYYSAIQSSVTANRMPKSPQSLLSTSEKTTINNWITAGHGYLN